MEYSIRFKLDVKKNVYVSKKRVDAEPYYQISAIIRINRRDELHYSLGFSAQRSAWFANTTEAMKGDGKRFCGIHKNHTAKKRSRIVQYTEVNRAIDMIEARLVSLSGEMDDISKVDLIKVLDKAIGKVPRKAQQEKETALMTAVEECSLWQLAELYCNDKRVRYKRNKIRRNAMDHFKSFQAHLGKEITFPQCTALLMEDFEHYLKEDGKDPDKYSHISRNVNRPSPKCNNTRSKIIKAVLCFFRWCRDKYEIENIGNALKYKAPTEKYGDPVIMTHDEKIQIRNLKLEDKELEYYRDLFLFQCDIGSRISDFENLKYENLIYDFDKWCIRYQPIKTKNKTAIECRVPLSEAAYSIFKKYELENPTPKTPLFSFQSVGYNKKLKQIFKMAGVDRKVPVTNSDDEIEYLPLYDIISSKFARSSFVDTLVSKNQTSHLISTMSGHAANSRAFGRYTNSHKEELQNEAVGYL